MYKLLTILYFFLSSYAGNSNSNLIVFIMPIVFVLKKYRSLLLCHCSTKTKKISVAIKVKINSVLQLRCPLKGQYFEIENYDSGAQLFDTEVFIFLWKAFSI